MSEFIHIFEKDLPLPLRELKNLPEKPPKDRRKINLDEVFTCMDDFIGIFPNAEQPLTLEDRIYLNNLMDILDGIFIVLNWELGSLQKEMKKNIQGREKKLKPPTDPLLLKSTRQRKIRDKITLIEPVLPPMPEPLTFRDFESEEFPEALRFGPFEPAEIEVSRIPVDLETPSVTELPRLPEGLETPLETELPRLPEDLETPLETELPRPRDDIETPMEIEVPRLPEDTETPLETVVPSRGSESMAAILERVNQIFEELEDWSETSPRPGRAAPVRWFKKLIPDPHLDSNAFGNFIFRKENALARDFNNLESALEQRRRLMETKPSGDLEFFSNNVKLIQIQQDVPDAKVVLAGAVLSASVISPPARETVGGEMVVEDGLGRGLSPPREPSLSEILGTVSPGRPVAEQQKRPAVDLSQLSLPPPTTVDVQLASPPRRLPAVSVSPSPLVEPPLLPPPPLVPLSEAEVLTGLREKCTLEVGSTVPFTELCPLTAPRPRAASLFGHLINFWNSGLIHLHQTGTHPSQIFVKLQKF